MATAPDVTDDLVGARAATARLLDALEAIDDDMVRAPSRLPGWSVAHVLTHLARDADSRVRLLRGAFEGGAVNRYPGGSAQRTREIERGATRPAIVCVADVRDSAGSLDAVWNDMTPDAWTVTGRAIDLDEPAHRSPWARWREVEVHLADLGLDGFGYHDWSRGYVRRELRLAEMAWRAGHPMGLTPLPAAALGLAPHDRLAWLLGRSEVEGLPRVAEWW